jgi:site-specific recombinase XerD
VGLVKPMSYHMLQHASPTHLPKDGHDIRTIEELLGHRDVKATMMYTHVQNRGGQGVYNPSTASEPGRRHGAALGC